METEERSAEEAEGGRVLTLCSVATRLAGRRRLCVCDKPKKRAEKKMYTLPWENVGGSDATFYLRTAATGK
jgi:hypothetical protein